MKISRWALIGSLAIAGGAAATQDDTIERFQYIAEMTEVEIAEAHVKRRLISKGHKVPGAEDIENLSLDCVVATKIVLDSMQYYGMNAEESRLWPVVQNCRRIILENVE